MNGSIQTRIGAWMAQGGCILMVLGGLGDQSIRELLPTHLAILQTSAGPVPPACAGLALALLHALGGALMAVGIGAFALLRILLATDNHRLGLLIAAMVLASEGANAWQMQALQQPLFVVPLSITGLVVVGLGLMAFGARCPGLVRRVRKAPLR